MQNQIIGVYSTKKGFVYTEIFGYCTQGIPGLEINGLGKEGKRIKEKFIYLSKVRCLKIPLKKYNLCVDINDPLKDQKGDDFSWLELPLILLFWTLSQNIKIHSLSDCLCFGKISATGNIFQSSLPDQFLDQVLKDISQRNINRLKYVAQTPFYQGHQTISFIPIQSLLDSISNLNYFSNPIENQNLKAERNLFSI